MTDIAAPRASARTGGPPDDEDDRRHAALVNTLGWALVVVVAMLLTQLHWA